MRSLVDDLDITVFWLTHDLDTLLTVVDRIIVLGEASASRRHDREILRSDTSGSSRISQYGRWLASRRACLVNPATMEAEAKYTYVGIALIVLVAAPDCGVVWLNRVGCRGDFKYTRSTSSGNRSTGCRSGRCRHARLKIGGVED